MSGLRVGGQGFRFYIWLKVEVLGFRVQGSLGSREGMPRGMVLFLFLTLSLSLSLPPSPSMSLSLFLSFSVSLSLSLCLAVCVSLSLCYALLASTRGAPAGSRA